MAYADVDDLKTYLDISGTGDDLLLSSLIDRAQVLVENITRRDFEVLEDSTRYFDAVEDVDGKTLWVEDDLCAITTITNGDGVEVASDEYVTEPRNATPYYSIKLLTSSNKSWAYETDAENAISITGRWGWSTQPPADIVQAVIRLAAYLYRQRDNHSDLDRPVSVDGGMMLPTRFPADVMEICMQYRRTY